MQHRPSRSPLYVSTGGAVYWWIAVRLWDFAGQLMMWAPKPGHKGEGRTVLRSLGGWANVQRGARAAGSAQGA
jgi:hypothetical protein